MACRPQHEFPKRPNRKRATFWNLNKNGSKPGPEGARVGFGEKSPPPPLVTGCFYSLFGAGQGILAQTQSLESAVTCTVSKMKKRVIGVCLNMEQPPPQKKR